MTEASYEYMRGQHPRSILETTRNTRELGGYRIAGTDKITPYKVLLRSDVPKHPSNGDIRKLLDMNVRTIIDMRRTDEVERGAHGFSRVEGFRYFNIPINDGSDDSESVEAVPYSYMAIARSRNMAGVFGTVARADTGVMFNCAAGKDRTGVVSAILLMAYGVGEEDIVYDYMLSRELNKELFDKIRACSPEQNMDVVIPNEKTMGSFIKLFLAEFGDTDNYFNSIGLSYEEIDLLHEKLKGVSL